MNAVGRVLSVILGLKRSLRLSSSDGTVKVSPTCASHCLTALIINTGLRGLARAFRGLFNVFLMISITGVMHHTS